MPEFGLTPELYEFIKHEEGWRPRPYLCQAGYPTQGWGHRIPSLDHREITVAEGMEWLTADLTHARDIVLRLSPGLKDEPERRTAALTDFCFNLGGANYAGSQLKLRVNEKEWAKAGVQMRRWVYAKDPKTGQKRPLDALIRRRDMAAKWLEAE